MHATFLCWDEELPFLETDVAPCEVPMCQNLMILARFGELHTRLDLGVLPPLFQRSLIAGVSRWPSPVTSSEAGADK
jgi:hypothetical protein